MIALYWGLGILAGLVFLSWLITRLNLEVDVATGERRLSRSSALGKYYDFVTFDLFYHKWNKLTTCTIGRRLLFCTLLAVFPATLALALLGSAVFTAYWVIKWGFVYPVKTAPWYIHVGYVLGVAVWFAGCLAGILRPCVFGVIRLVEWRQARRVEASGSGTRQESALVAAYRSARDGVCHKVKVVE